MVTFFGYQNGEKNGRKISEKENRKKNFSLWADAPLPTEKIWEREKQKQIIYANEYRNTINDGDSQETEEFIRRYLRYASSGLQPRVLNPNLIFNILAEVLFR